MILLVVAYTLLLPFIPLIMLEYLSFTLDPTYIIAIYQGIVP